MKSFWRTGCWRGLLAAVVLIVVGEAFAQPVETDLRLHCAWGGGSERIWRGRISLDFGGFRDLRLLGIDPDSPGSTLLFGKQILIDQSGRRGYDGFEVTVQAPLEAVLRVELMPDGEMTAEVVDVPLAELAQGYRSQALDDQGNRLVLRRAAGDALRIRFDRDHLVFSPGESLSAEIVPHLLDLPAGGSIRLTMELRATASGELVWDQIQTLRADDQGRLPRQQPVAVPLPLAEGVYDLDAALTTRRLATPFVAEKPIARSRVQLVVISDRTEAVPEEEARRLVFELDPTQSNWWQRLTRLPQWSLLPGFRTEGPLGNVKTEVIQRGDRDWVQLPIGGWQAYPLPIDEVGVPHELELDFPGDQPQTLAISIVEPNAAGKVVPIGLDSGIHLSEDDVVGVATRSLESPRHRLPFWPRTTSPLVLVTNLQGDRPGVFGRFRVSRVSQFPAVPAPVAGHRKVIAFFERPLFAECFQAAEALDAETGRSLEDWQTYFEGGQRLVRHLRHVGYDGLAITCASEGSALFESSILQPTPKYDRGVFFGSGQDPVRKDVLEMLFRMCDREQLTLIPTIEFATPLPALERLRRTRSRDFTGVDLVDAHGSSWVQRHGVRRGKAAYYNPLDPRVQQAMLAVIREVVSRYGDHSAFGGVAIHLHPHGFAQMPDEGWGLDPRTVRRFQADTENLFPETAVAGGGPLAAWIQGPARAEWLSWRSDQLRTFYQQMGRIVQQQNPSARLYLSGARLIESRPVQRAFRPALPRQTDIQMAMKELGMDWGDRELDAGLVFLRPHLFTIDEASSEGASCDFNAAEDVDRYFAGGGEAGSQFLHDPVGWRLPTFDEISPFGKANTLLSLVAQVSPPGANNRRRFIHALSSGDAQVVFEGGWMLPLGQEDSLREFFEVYRQLPTGRFRSLMEDDRRTQPVQIRALEQEGTTYVYLLNDSPWRVGVSLMLELPDKAKLEPLGRPTIDPLQHQDDGQAVWDLNLKPYDLVAVRLNAAPLRVVDATVTLPPDVMGALQTRIASLGSRAAQLRNPPMLDLLKNPGFEQPQTNNLTPQGWDLEGDPQAIQPETADVYEGRQAVRVNGGGRVVLLRSESFVPPSTGRLSISLRAKSADAQQQPRVRVVLEADGRPYYPWSPIGAGDPDRSLTAEWKEFVFRVSQLPEVKSSLKIGVEVSGDGDVLVDDVRLYDLLVLDDHEQKALAHILSVADFQLRKGFVADCLRSLNGYWPRYLMAHVAEAVPEVAERPAPKSPPLPSSPPNPSGWNRIRRFVPRLPRF